MKSIGIVIGAIFVVMIFLECYPSLGMSEDNAMEKWMQDHTIKVNATTTCKYEQEYLLVKEIYTGEELKERFGIEQFTKELKIPVEGKVFGMKEGEEKVFVTEKVTVLTSEDDPPHWWDDYKYPQWTWFKDWWSGVYERGLPINLAWKNTTKDIAKAEILEEGWVDDPVEWAEYVYDPIHGWIRDDGVADDKYGLLGRYHAVLWQMSDGNVVANAHHDDPFPHEADELEEAEELVVGYFNESDDTEWGVYEDSYNLDNNVTSPYSNGWCTQINYFTSPKIEREPSGNITSGNTVFTGEHRLHFNTTALPDVYYLRKQDYTEVISIPDPTDFDILAGCAEGVYDIMNTTGGDIGDLTLKQPSIVGDVYIKDTTDSIVGESISEGTEITIRAVPNFGGLMNESVPGGNWSKIKIKLIDPDGLETWDKVDAEASEVYINKDTTGWDTGTWTVRIVSDRDTCNGVDVSSPEYEFTICSEFYVPFDTGKPANPYPSIFGTHNGTITPNQTITVNKLYTYPCAGTGGHTNYARIWNNSCLDVNASWKGYVGDWHNISFNQSFTLVKNKTYNYTIHTGSYPQIHHTDELDVASGTGTITCDKFIDANGRVYYDWIPAIKLE